MSNRHPLLAGFFAFGALMCGLTLLLLTFPGTELDQLWRLNPEARRGFESLGSLSNLLMVVVGIACGMCAVGLWRGRRWGTLLAIAILSVNIAGDVFNAFGRGDYRSLIGLPVGGAMIFYLGRSNRRSA